MKKPTELSLTWNHALVFTGHAGTREVVTDGDGVEGLSPVELLAVATAGCMAVDVVHILGKARQVVTAMRIGVTAERAQTEPHRFTFLHLAFTLDGQVSQAQLDRALQLSRDKYCSVWNSLREDIRLEVSTMIHATP